MGLGRTFIWTIFSLLLGFSVNAHEEPTRDIDFDSLFPTTPYKKVLDAAQHCIADAQAWLESFKYSHDDQTLLLCVELLIGRLVNLQCLTKNLVNEKTPILEHDVVYFNQLVHQLEQYADVLTDGLPRERGEQVKMLFGEIKGVLQRISISCYP